MNKGDLIDMSKNSKCPSCGKDLNFEWEGMHSDRKIAICCGKEYWIIPSKFYEIEFIKSL